MQDLLHLLERTADGVWAVDANQRIVLWTSVAQELLGYTPKEAIGQFCHQLLAGRDASGKTICRAGCAVHRHALRGELADSHTVDVRHRDGRRVPINISLIVAPHAEVSGREITLVHLFRLLEPECNSVPALRICLLGPVAVQRADGSQVSGILWRRAKTRGLLALLALRRGQKAHRDVLLSGLWPDLEHEPALHNLNTTIYYLRRSLEPGLQHGLDSRYIRYEADCYWLEGGRAHWLDVDAFEAAVTLARRLDDPARAAEEYSEALSLYRGEFVADLDPDLIGCWIERERLGELYLNAMGELAERLTELGRVSEAAELHLRVLALEPCREADAQQLMRLALRRGDRVAAVTCYQRLEAALRQDLDLFPSAETKSLYDKAVFGTEDRTRP